MLSCKYTDSHMHFLINTTVFIFCSLGKTRRNSAKAANLGYFNKWSSNNDASCHGCPPGQPTFTTDFEISESCQSNEGNYTFESKHH